MDFAHCTLTTQVSSITDPIGFIEQPSLVALGACNTRVFVPIVCARRANHSCARTAKHERVQASALFVTHRAILRPEETSSARRRTVVWRADGRVAGGIHYHLTPVGVGVVAAQRSHVGKFDC